MFASIISYGLAVGAVYALIGITYNVMFSASRVFSFTAGMLGMLGGVLGALFINKWGMNAVLGFVAVLGCGAVLGLVTEILTVLAFNIIGDTLRALTDPRPGAL